MGNSKFWLLIFTTLITDNPRGWWSLTRSAKHFMLILGPLSGGCFCNETLWVYCWVPNTFARFIPAIVWILRIPRQKFVLRPFSWQENGSRVGGGAFLDHHRRLLVGTAVSWFYCFWSLLLILIIDLFYGHVLSDASGIWGMFILLPRWLSILQGNFHFVSF